MACSALVSEAKFLIDDISFKNFLGCYEIIACGIVKEHLLIKTFVCTFRRSLLVSSVAPIKRVRDEPEQGLKFLDFRSSNQREALEVK